MGDINIMKNLFLADTSGSTTSGTEQLKKIFTQPAFYIVIGVIVLLIILFVIFRRFVRAHEGEEVIVLRKGKIFKILTAKDEKRYFLRFFKDKVGATINMNEQTFSSDKVFINDGPDALYKLHFAVKYKVVNSEAYYPKANNFADYFAESLNDECRLFAKVNGASLIIKDFDGNKKKIISHLNNVYLQNGVEITDFKINAIEPFGRK